MDCNCNNIVHKGMLELLEKLKLEMNSWVDAINNVLYGTLR